MHQLPIEQQVLLIVEIAALIALCTRMWLAGLQRVYVNFFRYLVLELLQALIPLFVPLASPLYRDLFVASQAFIVAFYALVVLELYSVILRNLAGIAGVARRYIKVTLAFAILVSLLPLRIEKTPNTLTGYLFILERPILSSLVAFVLLISGFLVYYPVPLGRNVIAYLAGYAVYFPTIATMAFFQNLGYFWNRQKGNVDMGISVACLTFWLLALNRAGENKRVVVGHHWNPGDEQRLLAQLEEINASLLRSRN
ncbi:MAG: hypothetical protein WBE37_12535 [Bryobacteraceae bacterium]